MSAEGRARPLDARWALAGCLAAVLLVVLTPLGAWRALAAEWLGLALAAGFLGVEPGRLARRLATFAPLLVVLALLMGYAHPVRPTLGFPATVLAILARAGLAVALALTLALAYSGPELLGAARRLGCPAVLVSTLHFMNRYAHVLGEERDRMLVARRARMFGTPTPFWKEWVSLGGLLGSLFLRAMDRGDRVHRAMLARGWDGTIRSLDDPEAHS